MNNYNIKTDLVSPGEALFEMVLEHPLFKNKEISIVPDPTIKSSFGTGINPVCPLSSIHDLDIAEKYNLPIESFLTKDGVFTDELGSEFDGTNPFNKGNEICEELIKSNGSSFLNYQYEYPYNRVSSTKERVLLNPLDSWFFKITESLKKK